MGPRWAWLRKHLGLAWAWLRGRVWDTASVSTLPLAVPVRTVTMVRQAWTPSDSESPGPALRRRARSITVARDLRGTFGQRLRVGLEALDGITGIGLLQVLGPCHTHTQKQG